MTHYKAVLEQIQAKRAALGVELSELELLETGINKLAGLGTNGALLLNSPPNTAALDFPRGTLKEFSVREAALKVLSQANGPVRTGELATILKAGGIRTKGKNFANQVSSVLATMAGKHEVVRTKNGFALAAHGREVWGQLEASLAKVDVR